MARDVELIGRERELCLLAERLERAGAGEGGLLLVSGDAGVGKTSLLEVALVRCPFLVLRGWVGHEGRSPYAPLVTALRAYERLVPGAGYRGHSPTDHRPR